MSNTENLDLLGRITEGQPRAGLENDVETSQTRQRFSGSQAVSGLRISASTVPNAAVRMPGFLTNRPGHQNRNNPASFVVEMPFQHQFSQSQAQQQPQQQQQQQPVTDPDIHLSMPSQGLGEGGNPGNWRFRDGNAANSNNEQNNEGSRDEDVTLASILTQLVGSSPEVAAFFATLEKYIPFILILSAKVLFEYSTGIFVFIALAATFFHANSVVCREVGRNGRRSILPLVVVMINLAACIVFIYFVFEDEKLYLSAVFMLTRKVDSLSELLWIVGVNDFVLKFAAVIVKIVVVLLPASVLLHRKRGNYFLFIEMSSQLHRGLVPIPVWLFYLLDVNGRIPSKVLGVILTAAYMVFKGKTILKTVLAWKLATSKILHSTRYGKSPSSAEVDATDGTCPICHDNLMEPTILNCKHIFCEECVATWFDRETTCPMCRAQVTEDPAWRDGSTSQFLQLF